MSDLGELLGTLMVSLAKARQIADAETAAMAEWYKNHPLLEGIGAPRVRVQEMILEIPLLLKDDEAGEPNEIAEPRAIAEAARAQLVASAKKVGVELTGEIADSAASEITAGVSDLRVRSKSSTTRSISRESVVRVTEAAVMRALSRAPSNARIEADKLRTMMADVRGRVQEIAEIKPGSAPRIGATLVTSEVKEKADPNTVTRIRVALREEGVEWSTTRASDGTSVRRLAPE